MLSIKSMPCYLTLDPPFPQRPLASRMYSDLPVKHTSLLQPGTVPAAILPPARWPVRTSARSSASTSARPRRPVRTTSRSSRTLTPLAISGCSSPLPPISSIARIGAWWHRGISAWSLTAHCGWNVARPLRRSAILRGLGGSYSRRRSCALGWRCRRGTSTSSFGRLTITPAGLATRKVKSRWASGR